MKVDSDDSSGGGSVGAEFYHPTPLSTQKNKKVCAKKKTLSLVYISS